jgi:hypothetical protein
MGSVIIAGCLVVVESCFATAVGEAAYVVRAMRTESPKIDGFLSDDCWQKASVVTGFIQQNPDEGAPATQTTEVRVLYDKTNLYVAFTCYDDESDKIMNRLGRRDQAYGVDRVDVYVDSYHDHRSGVRFGTTPRGVEIDSYLGGTPRMFGGGGRGGFGRMDTSWDGVWEVESRIYDWGWSAEFRIPFMNMRFKESENYNWGLQFHRRIERNKEEAYWVPVSRDEGFKVENFGHLTGLTGISGGRHIEFRPYVIGDFKGETGRPLFWNEKSTVAGTDIKYQISPGLTADATLRPDFAQIEADEDRIDLSGYEIRLREKRPFFLEGQNIFQTPLDLFYSRRIGKVLADGSLANIVGGGKVTGKMGQYNLGVINAYTEGMHYYDDDALEHEAPTNYSVFRLSRDILRSSQVGFLTTSMDNEYGFNRSVAADFNFRLPRQFRVNGQVANTFVPGQTGDHHGAVLQVGQYLDQFTFSFNYRDLSPGFEPELGYQRYNDTRGGWIWASYRPRIEAYGIRRIMNSASYGQSYLYNGMRSSRHYDVGTWIQTMNYWRLSVNVNNREGYNRVDERTYRGYEWRASIENDYSSPFNFDLSYRGGSFKEGKQDQYSLRLTVKPTSTFTLEFDPVWNRTYHGLRDSYSFEVESPWSLLPEPSYVRDTDWNRYLIRATHNITKRLSWRLFAQYTTFLERFHDPQSDELEDWTGYPYEIEETDGNLGANILVSYWFQPGSVIYFAIDESRDVGSAGLGAPRRVYITKVNYWFSL